MGEIKPEKEERKIDKREKKKKRTARARIWD